MKERKDRIDDAVHAVAASVEGGIIPGGGSTMIWAYNDFIMNMEDLNKDVKLCMQYLCKAPTVQLLINMGLESQRISDIFNTISENQEREITYDIIKDKFVKYESNGIYDPAYALIKSLQNTASVVKTILNTSSMLVEESYV